MAKRKTKGSLAGKLGARGKKVFDRVKTNEVQYSSAGELPPGIEGGIAELVDCKFDTFAEGKQNEGEYYFYAAGIVHSPKLVKGENGDMVPIQGQRTSIMEAICDTPGRTRESVDDHLGWVVNEVKKLGIDTDDMDDLDVLEGAVVALKEERPFFRFRTWKGDATTEFPNPRTNHQWSGVKGLEDYAPDDDEDVEEDSIAKEEEAREKTSISDFTSDELNEIGEMADNDDEKAIEELEKLCKEKGIDSDEHETWVEVASVLLKENEEDIDEDESIEPVKGEVYRYKPRGSKDRVECEVTAVVKTKETCTLKDLENEGEVYKDVSWSVLSYEEE